MKLGMNRLALSVLVGVLISVAFSGCGPSHGRLDVGGKTLLDHDDNGVIVVKNNIGGVLLQVGGVTLQTGQEVLHDLGDGAGYGPGVEVTADVLQEGPDGLIYIGLARVIVKRTSGYGHSDMWLSPKVWIVNNFESVRDLNKARSKY